MSTSLDSRQLVTKISGHISLVILKILFATFNLLGNSLIIWVIHKIPKSKLRKTTRLLICYVSSMHCFTSILIFTKIIVPCFVVLLSSIILALNFFSGMLYLALETFVVIKKPHDHRKFVTMKSCTTGILFAFGMSVCFAVLAYLTMKEPENQSYCFLTNGLVNPFCLCSFTASLFIMFSISSALQICTIRSLRKTFPENRTSQQLAVYYVPSNPAPIAIVPAQVANHDSSPLHRLTKILSVSLICSIFCWSPIDITIFTFSLLEILNIEVRIEQQILSSFNSLILLHGSLHFIIFLVMSTQIRQAVKKYFQNWLIVFKIVPRT